MGDSGHVAKSQVNKLRTAIPHWSILLGSQLVGFCNLTIAWLLYDHSLDEAAAEGLAWGVGFGVALWVGPRIQVAAKNWAKQRLADQLRRISRILQELGIEDSPELQPGEVSEQYAWWARAWWLLSWSLMCILGFALTGIFLAHGDIRGATSLSINLSLFGGIWIGSATITFGSIIRSEWRLRQLESAFAAAPTPQPWIEELGVVRSVRSQCHHIDRVPTWPIRVAALA